jgi:predicted nucleic acid-binding protein
MGDDFVVDNSIVMAWCFEDEATAYTDAVQDQLVESTAFVPAIWPLEVTNVLLVAERKNRIGKADSGHFIALLSQLPIKVEPTESERAFHDILSLARQYQLSSYDASYLELAIRKGLPIASLDKAIARAAIDMKILYKE